MNFLSSLALAHVGQQQKAEIDSVLSQYFANILTQFMPEFGVMFHLAPDALMKFAKLRELNESGIAFECPPELLDANSVPRNSYIQCLFGNSATLPVQDAFNVVLLFALNATNEHYYSNDNDALNIIVCDFYHELHNHLYTLPTSGQIHRLID